ncbi:MAG: peptidylprolyl isomerase [Alphaproteobacteria bacterium]|nr:peptidylprolyl isomerase [Alphaproteobacteria bacterium]
MTRFLLYSFFCLAVFAAGSLPHTAQARSEGIAVVVNEDAITDSDLNDRLKLVIVSSGLPDNQDTRLKLVPQVVASLIDEQIMLQEARRLDISVSQEEINQGFATIAAQNNVEPAKFKSMLQNSGINTATMENQIESQISWSKVIQQKLRPQLIISEKDVDDVIERLHRDKGKSEFLLAEIFLPVDDPKEEGDARQLADRLAGQIKSGKAPFFRVAQQFSKAAGAARGGDMGWIQQGQLPDELDATLQTLSKNEVSAPVRSLSGYHILYVRDKRLISEDTIPPREEIFNDLGIKRLERMQRRYMMDLKSQAFIENRARS